MVVRFERALWLSYVRVFEVVIARVVAERLWVLGKERRE